MLISLLYQFYLTTVIKYNFSIAHIYSLTIFAGYSLTLNLFHVLFTVVALWELGASQAVSYRF